MPDRSKRGFPEQLDLLSEKLLLLGGLVEQAIGLSVRSLIDRDSRLAEKVVAEDARVDQMELEIDELCMELLALQQPMAKDLRFIATAMKIKYRRPMLIKSSELKWKIPTRMPTSINPEIKNSF